MANSNLAGMSDANPESWGLRKKVRQLFIVGFHGTTPADTVHEFVLSGVGGIIYFARNIDSPEQVAELSRSLQRTAEEGDNPPLLIAVDEEGGIVSRLPWEGQLPGQMAIGAGGDPVLAKRAAAAKGCELRAIGVNVNLTPVLDVNNNPDNPIIGVRSFGEDPDLVSELGVSTAMGYQDANVVACGKHFPGHGDTEVDSHLDLPVIDHGRTRLDRVELVPFRGAVDAGIGAIMTTHVAFPTIAEEPDRPATLSKNVLTGLLREEMAYDGLVVTDCLEMDAIAETVGTPEAAVQAIEAGSDLVTVSHTPETQRASIDAVVEAVESGRIRTDRIDDSVRRILRTKDAYAVGEHSHEAGGAVGDGTWRAANNESRRVGRRIAELGVTVVRDRAWNIPVDDSRVHVVHFAGGFGSDVEDSRTDPGEFVSSLRNHGFAVDLHRIDSDSMTLEVVEPLPADLGADETIVICTCDAVNDYGQVELVSRVNKSDADLVVLSIRNPYDLSVFPEIETYLTTYDDTPVSLAVAADIIAGKHDAVGRLPVTMPTE